MIQDIIQNNWRPPTFKLESNLEYKNRKSIISTRTGLLVGDIFFVKGDSIKYYVHSFVGFSKNNFRVYSIKRVDKVAISTTDQLRLKQNNICIFKGYLT